MTFHYIFTGDKDNNDDLLHSGSHYFPFEFTLPPKLPSSFKGKHGRLRYYVRLTICTPGGPNHERTSKFAVISSLDLNKEPDALVRYTKLPRYTKLHRYTKHPCCGIFSWNTLLPSELFPAILGKGPGQNWEKNDRLNIKMGRN